MNMKTEKVKLAGPCPICNRLMLLNGQSVDRHHLVPRSLGGKEQFLVHRMCHQKLHSLFNEKELGRTYATWSAIKANPDMQTFIDWIQKKPIDYYDRNISARSKRKNQP